MSNKNKEPKFFWNKQEGIASCVIKDGNKNYIGIAHCHPEDFDMKNQMTGQIIALLRAEIKYLKNIKDNELKYSLKSLKQLYYSMNQSKLFNPKSYENKMLQRQIKIKEEELLIITNLLNRKKQELDDFIHTKETLYQKIRMNRTGQKQ